MAFHAPCLYRHVVTLSQDGSSPRLAHFRVQNYRSIGPEPVTVVMPESGPLVVLGENNAGKSNINRAIEHLFGERWPGTFQPEAHDFHGRDSDGIAIKIDAVTQNVVCDCGGTVKYIGWDYDANRVEGEPCIYSKRCSSCSKTYMNKGIRSQLFGMLVGADRGLGYQLSYSSKFTLLSKLMHRFHGALLSDPTRKETLGKIFGSIVDQFNGVDEFAKFRTVLANMTSELAGTLSYRLDIDFTAYDPSNFFKSLRVHPYFAGEVRSFEELGSGQGESWPSHSRTLMRKHLATGRDCS
jgi:putative ATP-dependent endonuclease of OLD family